MRLYIPNTSKNRNPMKRKSIYNEIKEALALAANAIIAAPIKLPPKVVLVAKYVALAIGVLDAVEGAAKEKGGGDEG